jgi:hypothetical protein
VYERCNFFPFYSLIGFVDFVVCVITRFVFLFFIFFIGYVGSEPWVVILWWLVFFPLSFLIGVVFFMLWANLICFVLWYGFLYIYIYIYIYIISLYKFDDNETIQEVDATSVHNHIINKFLIYLHTKLRCFRASRGFATSLG